MVLFAASTAKKVSPMKYPSPPQIPPGTSQISGLHGKRAAQDCKSEKGLDVTINCSVLTGYYIQGGPSGRGKPPVDLVPALLAAGGPLL